MSEYAIRLLGAATWDAFVALAEKHNGVWGGCWCTWFHPACAEKGESSEANRAPTRSVWFAKARLMPPWSSTVTSRWPGANTVLRTSFRASTT
jgi:hypothetical protein